MSISTRTGHCACGAVSFEAEVPTDYGACHCDTCRRWAGGVYMAVRGREVRFSAPETILRWRSSELAERGSCRHCGSALFWRALDSNDHMLNIGAFADQSGFRLVREAFVDEQPEHYRFAGEHEGVTGAEAMLKYGGGDAARRQ